MDNISQQADEMEALTAIYDDKWSFDANTSSYSMDVAPNVKLFISLNSDYPSSKPPSYELSAPLLKGAEKHKIDEEFQSIYEQNLGSPILFQWIEKLKELVEDSHGKGRNIDRKESVSEPVNTDEAFNSPISNKSRASDVIKEELPFKVFHGPTIQDRKSVFQGHCAKVTSLDAVRQVIEHLMENRKIAQATHNISSYRLQTSTGALLQDCDDDGEAHAGGRLLHLLQILNLSDVVVVVSRWYGGVHLGPDRFRHINNAARQVLAEAGFIS